MVLPTMDRYPLFSALVPKPPSRDPEDPPRPLYRPPALRLSLAPSTPFPRRQRAFVVNVHDLLNLDLDLLAPYPAPPVPGESRYTFITSFSDRPNVYQHQDGVSCRCRLINIQKKPQTEETYTAYRNAMHQLMCRIDMQNGWVDVALHHIDRYQRRLIELFDPVTGENLGEWLVRTTQVVQFFKV